MSHVTGASYKVHSTEVGFFGGAAGDGRTTKP